MRSVVDFALTRGRWFWIAGTALLTAVVLVVWVASTHTLVRVDHRMPPGVPDQDVTTWSALDLGMNDLRRTRSVFGITLLNRDARVLMAEAGVAQSVRQIPPMSRFSIHRVDMAMSAQQQVRHLSAGAYPCTLALESGIYNYPCVNPQEIAQFVRTAERSENRTIARLPTRQDRQAWPYVDGLIGITRPAGAKNPVPKLFHTAVPAGTTTTAELPARVLAGGAGRVTVVRDPNTASRAFAAVNVGSGVVAYYPDWDAEPKIFAISQKIDPRTTSASCALGKQRLFCFAGPYAEHSGDYDVPDPEPGTMYEFDLAASEAPRATYRLNEVYAFDEFGMTADGSLFVLAGLNKDTETRMNHSLYRIDLGQGTMSLSRIGANVSNIAFGTDLYWTVNAHVYRYSPATGTFGVAFTARAVAASTVSVQNDRVVFTGLVKADQQGPIQAYELLPQPQTEPRPEDTIPLALGPDVLGFDYTDDTIRVKLPSKYVTVNGKAQIDTEARKASADTVMRQLQRAGMDLSRYRVVFTQ